MTHSLLLPLLIVVFVTLARASNLLENGLIFEDIRIENIDTRAVAKKVAKKTTNILSILSGDAPTFTPTAAPTEDQSETPTFAPTINPTEEPTEAPTEMPTETPTEMPTAIPTAIPTAVPSAVPTRTPSAEPTAAPTRMPTAIPTYEPTFAPSVTPTFSPTAVPSFTPAPTGAVQEGVKILGTLTAIGTSADTFNSDPNNAVVFGYTVDQASNLPQGTTQVGEAYEPSTGGLRRLQGSDPSCIVPFTIVIASTTSVGYPNADAAYNSILEMINTAVAADSLTSSMQTIAAANGIVFLLNVQITNAAVDSFVATDPPSNRRRYVNDGEIAGIVIGSIVGVALLGVMVYYYLRMRRASLGETSSDDKGDRNSGGVYRDTTIDKNDGPLTIMNEPSAGAHETSLVLASDNDTRV